MSRIPRRPLAGAGALAVLALAPVVAVLAAPPDSTTLVSRPPGFGALASPAVNDSWTGVSPVRGASQRLVGDAQNNRYVAFTSEADGLSAEDDDRFQNVYVRDRSTGRTILVSRADGAGGAGANGASTDPAVSPSGQYVAFTSTATNLTPDGANGLVSHVYVRDILNGTTILVDRADGANGALASDGASSPSVTFAGNQLVVAFMSDSGNLTPIDPGGVLQVFVRRGSTTNMVSLVDNGSTTPGNGSSTEPSLSGDGTRVAFTSDATNLTAVVDDNASSDIFVREIATNNTIFVTRASTIGDADSTSPSANQDGHKVAFASAANNFSLDDTSGGVQDVFVWDDDLPDATDILLASRAGSAPDDGGDQASGEPSIDASGNLVAFSSQATNLVPGDTNGTTDVFLRTLSSQTTGRISRGAPPGNAQYEDASAGPSLALNGDYVAFTTRAPNAADTDDDDFSQVFGRPLGITLAGPQHLSRPDGTAAFRSGVNASSLRPRQRTAEPVDAMSADGRYTVFLSDEDDLLADDDDRFTNVYRRDNLTGETILVSRADGPGGAAADGPSATEGLGGPTSPVGAPAISADGNRVVFASAATNLVPGDGNGRPDVFVRDVAAGQTIRASVAGNGAQLPAGAGDPAISGDGLRVAFSTITAIDAGDANGFSDVYLRDLAAGTTTLVSRQGPAGPAGDASSSEAALDLDGSHVAFSSAATNLPDGGGNGVASDVFVRDVAAGQTVLASRRSGPAGTIGNSFSSAPALSDDASRVAFSSGADNLATAGDLNGGVRDVFVRDLAAAQTLLVSRTTGANGVSPNGTSERPSISGDGTRVVFTTNAPDLIAGDQNGVSDVALRDLTTSTTSLVSRAPGAGGALGNATSDEAAISGNGACVAFTTFADNLVPQPAGVDFERVVARGLTGDCPFGPVPAPGQAPADPGTPGSPPPAGDPGAPPAGPSGGQTQLDRTKPVVTGLRATPARFRAGVRVAAARRGRPATGTSFRFTLSEPGRVTVTVSLEQKGRKVRKRCVPARRGVRGALCLRLVRRGALAATGRSGANRLSFAGRLAGRLLAPGRYRAVVVVRDAAGNASVARTARFTVLPRR